MDTREGITYNDVALYNWLNLHHMRLKSDHRKVAKLKRLKAEREAEGPSLADFEEAVVIPTTEERFAGGAYGD